MEAPAAVAENKKTDKKEDERIGFFKAWTLPKVALYAGVFFCSKMAVYCLLLQLPLCLKDTLKLDDQEVAKLSTLIDLGGIVGTFAIGFISDRMLGARSTILLISMVIAAAIFYALAREYDTMHLSNF